MPNKEISIDGITSFVMATLAPIGADLIIKSKFNKATKIWRARILFYSTLAGVFALSALLLENQENGNIFGYEKG